MTIDNSRDILINNYDSTLENREQHYKPGSIHRRVFGSSNVGTIKSVLLVWNHSTTMNILTWRFEAPVIYVESLTIETFNVGQKYVNSTTNIIIIIIIITEYKHYKSLSEFLKISKVCF